MKAASVEIVQFFLVHDDTLFDAFLQKGFDILFEVFLILSLGRSMRESLFELSLHIGLELRRGVREVILFIDRNSCAPITDFDRHLGNLLLSHTNSPLLIKIFLLTQSHPDCL